MDYEPIDKQGCWITPRPPADAAALEQAITPTLAQGHWIVTSLKDGRVLIEPRHTRFIQVQPPGPVYHVTTRDRRQMIWANGLELRAGGNTRMQPSTRRGRSSRSACLQRLSSWSFSVVETSRW